MIELSLFLAHCVAAFGAFALAWWRQAVGYPLAASLPAEVLRGVGATYRWQSRLVTWPLRAVELVTGIALLFDPDWLWSAFGLAMLVLVLALGFAALRSRPVLETFADPGANPAELLARLSRAGVVEVAAATLRTGLLVYVALF